MFYWAIAGKANTREDTPHKHCVVCGKRRDAALMKYYQHTHKHWARSKKKTYPHTCTPTYIHNKNTHSHTHTPPQYTIISVTNTSLEKAAPSAILWIFLLRTNLFSFYCVLCNYQQTNKRNNKKCDKKNNTHTHTELTLWCATEDTRTAKHKQHTLATRRAERPTDNHKIARRTNTILRAAQSTQNTRCESTERTERNTPNQPHRHRAKARSHTHTHTHKPRNGKLYTHTHTLTYELAKH